MMQESLDAADEVIATLQKQGHDYSAFRDQIARKAFNDGLLTGDYDITVKCPGKKSLRFIQEDEFDQHMDYDEDAPEIKDRVAYVCVIPAYVWMI